MFALKSHQLGSKKKVGLEKQQPEGFDGEDPNEVVKARFQEMGPKMTVKMRWIRRGALGETGDERNAREKQEKKDGVKAEEFGEVGEGEDPELGEVGGSGGKKAKRSEEDEEKLAAKEIGLVEGDETSQPNFDFAGAAAAAEASVVQDGNDSTITTTEEAPRPAKRPRTTPRKRSKPYHALLRPPPSPSPPPGGLMESEPVPLPPKDGRKRNAEDASLLSTVGKTWHAGKGEGGVREGKKRREWGWEVSFAFCLLFRTLADSLLLFRRPRCRSRGGSSSSERAEGLRGLGGTLCVMYPTAFLPRTSLDKSTAKARR